MQSAQQLIRFYYLFQSSITLMLWQPIFFEFQRSQGLAETQILNIQSLYYISFCVLELPTGFLADRLGHRRCLQAGALLHVVTHLLPLAWPNYAGFLWHWLLLALARSLVSGAASAYLYNQLERLGQVELYKQSEGRGRAWSLAIKVLGFVVADFLYRIHPGLTYVGSALFAGLACAIAFLLPNCLPIERPNRQGQPQTVRWSRVLTLVRRNPRMLVIMLQGIGLFSLTRIVQVNLFQPLLLTQGIKSHFGLVLAGATLLEAWAAANPECLRRWCSDYWALLWLTLAMGMCCQGLAQPGAANCLFWLNVFFVVTGLAYPIQRQVMNQHIPDSDYRASLLSAESLLDRGVCALIAHQLGLALNQQQQGAFLTGAAWASLATALLWPLYFAVGRPLNWGWSRR